MHKVECDYRGSSGHVASFKEGIIVADEDGDLAIIFRFEGRAFAVFLNGSGWIEDANVMPLPNGTKLSLVVNN